MEYYYRRTLSTDFQAALGRTREKLKEQGFGVLTEIDMRETMRNKLGVDFRNYQILGACNPSFAHKALVAEDKIGTMLPCNVIVQEFDNGQVEVAAVDPVASMQAVENETLRQVATQIQGKLRAALDAL